MDKIIERDNIPSPKGEYVLWCDGMGTSQELHRNMEHATIFILKIHLAFDEVSRKHKTVKIYPVMDGVYATCPTRDEMEDYIAEVYIKLVNNFISSRGTQNMFMVRGGIGYGPVIHGKDIKKESLYAKLKMSIKNQILLSPAMVDAYNAESMSPPFGVYVHNSAKVYPIIANKNDCGFRTNLYQWWKKPKYQNLYKTIMPKLYEQILFYFEKAEKHSAGMGYTKERIQAHKELAIEYFGGVSG